MREKYSNYITKFSSPLACYAYENYLMNGDFGDAEFSDPDGMGDWASVYGHHVLYGDDHGFVYLVDFPNTQEAINHVEAMNDLLYEDS